MLFLIWAGDVAVLPSVLMSVTDESLRLLWCENLAGYETFLELM